MDTVRSMTGSRATPALRVILLFFVILRFFNLSHKKTFPVAMHPGFVFINAKIFGYVFLIQLKTCIYEETRKV